MCDSTELLGHHTHTCMHRHTKTSRPEIRVGGACEEKRDPGLALTTWEAEKRTNVFNSTEMNFPVITTAAKVSLQSPDHSPSKR